MSTDDGRPATPTSRRRPAAPPALRTPLLPGKLSFSGRRSRSSATTFDLVNARVQMLALGTECRLLTTIRQQGSLPVLPLTVVTLWSRAMHSMLTLSVQDRVTSVVPLLCQRHSTHPTFRRTAATLARVCETEQEMQRLAQSPETLLGAIGLYRTTMLELSRRSLAPWILYARSHVFGVSNDHTQWLARALRAQHGHTCLGEHELLLCAYLRLGHDRALRDAVVELSMDPEPISAATLAAILAQLQGSVADCQLACRLWVGLSDCEAGFSPSRECVQLGLKAAIHSRDIPLALAMYRQVVRRRWARVRGGFWLDKIMVYGLTISGHVREALELVESGQAKYPMQTEHKCELLLRGLAKIRAPAADAEDAFLLMRDQFGVQPTAGMYAALLTALARAGSWESVDACLRLMADSDGHAVPASVWRQILLGFAEQGRVDLCDRVLQIMHGCGHPYTCAVVQAAVDVYARLGDLDMVLRWYRVVASAMAAQARLPPIQQDAVNIDGTRQHCGMGYAGSAAGTPSVPEASLGRPEEFATYFIARNELVWHRNVLAAVVEVAGDFGGVALVLRLWNDILSYRASLVTLRLSPQI
ncbi:hypothetical protein GGF46_000517 [Coemansia sp. RSA 552]|nr:hypothetical protein GGF46_000517 [Coemansia sp. RSA 552]